MRDCECNSVNTQAVPCQETTSLNLFGSRLRDFCTAEAESHEGKRKTETLWPIMRIVHTRSRYFSRRTEPSSYLVSGS